MKHETTNNSKRTSTYKENRISRLDRDGGYKYFSVDGSVTSIIPGENGISENWVILLDKMDHDEDLGDRYYEENQDLGYENYKASVDKNSTDEEYAPMSTLSTEPFNVLFRSDDYDPRIEELTAFIHSLPEDRQNLIYAFYGERKYLNEITDEENVANGTDISYQDVQKRLKKAVKACCDYYGVPMPKFRNK